MSFATNREKFFKYIAQTSDQPLALEFERAEGIYLKGKDKTYFDCISGISVSNVGHANPHVIKAVQDQLQKHLHVMVYGELVQQPQIALAEKLCSLLPPELQSVYFVNSGSEAIEAAMKLAKRYTGRKQFVALKKAYHGSTQGALSLMSESYFSEAFLPLLPGISFIEQNNLDEINTFITNETAAVFIEPVMGEKGYLPCDLNYLEAVRNRCKEVGSLLVFDEIQTGYGRTGSLFAFQKFNIIPDVLVLAKGFGGGLPLGAFIASTEIMSVLTDQPVLGHITTFGGHPLSCAASLAALNFIIDTNLLSSIDHKEALFRRYLQADEIKNIDGCGLMLAIKLQDSIDCRQVIDACVENGLLIDWFLYAEDKIRISPPLIISDEEIKIISGIILENIRSVVQP